MGLFEQVALQAGLPIWLFAIVLVWTLIWKGIALWKSAKSNHLIWFIAFLVIQTFGILEILYIFLFSKIKLPEENKPRKKSKKQKRKTKKI